MRAYYPQTYSVKLCSGIGGATRAALYKPLREDNQDKINAIMSATRIFLIMGIETFLQSLFGITNFIFLQADQKTYVPALAHIVCYILNTLLVYILIKCNFGIHIVKLGSSIAFSLYPVILLFYFRSHYSIDFKVEPDNVAIGQRWDAFYHQAAEFVMNNTDVIILTMLCPLTEVSVYSVYNLVVAAVKKLMSSFTDGLEAAFGSILAENKSNSLIKSFRLVEMIIFNVSTLVTCCCGNLIIEFVALYTRNINDADYIRKSFALVVVFAQFFNSIRRPYQIIVQAAGHYRQTKRGAIVEPVINIVLSIVMVWKFGLVGVAIGTLAATIFRTVQYSYYADKNLIPGSFLRMLIKTLVGIAEYILVTYIYFIIPKNEATTYWHWIGHSVLMLAISAVVIVIGMILFERKELRDLLERAKKFAARLGRKKG